MQIIYNGSDITQVVQINECYCNESIECIDNLDIAFDNIAGWTKWQPQQDDRIEVKDKGFTSTPLYIQEMHVDHGKFHLVACGMPTASGTKKTVLYRNITLKQLMEQNAAECGMKYAIYGLDPYTEYPALLRKNEGPGAFLDRVLRWEGAYLKAVNGKLAAISWDYAAKRPITETIQISKKFTHDTFYFRMYDKKTPFLTIQTPYAKGTAQDRNVSGQSSEIITGLPAFDDVTAARWARGILQTENMAAEKLGMTTDLNTGLQALTPVLLKGEKNTEGKWLVAEVTHYLMWKKTHVVLHRLNQDIQ